MSYIDLVFNSKNPEVTEHVIELFRLKKIHIGFVRADGKMLVYDINKNLIWSSHKIRRW